MAGRLRVSRPAVVWEERFAVVYYPLHILKRSSTTESPMMAEKKTSEVVLPVLDGEDPWTPEEVAEQREDLVDELERLEKRIEESDAELAELLTGGNDGAGRDPADVGSSNFERDQEMSLVHNVREMADQLRLALTLFDQGEYGYCEACGEPIGKGRLQVFPRATMCVTCKQREERR